MRRYEDDLLAYGWKEFLDNEDYEYRWLPRLPMVKGAM